MAAHLGLIETIDRAVSWAADRWRLSPGERIVALLVNLWTEREPLYRVQEAFALTDPALLLGQGITPIGVKISSAQSGGHKRQMSASTPAGGRGPAIPYGCGFQDNEGPDP